MFQLLKENCFNFLAVELLYDSLFLTLSFQYCLHKEGKERGWRSQALGTRRLLFKANVSGIPVKS
jgi:hypothetical protein